ncbi:MAG: TonB-dependent receptor [Calditrichia bacterium]|nr:TonB-dependent receptor [Calditrichota bacterium]MCB0269504.1 TonB-dependent receptor [Calditrichota bacterium]MCB9069506.1 TonB-dependent receptor [Calditrichia bacterium]
MTKYLSILLALFSIAFAVAQTNQSLMKQTGIVAGKVFDSQTKSPLAFVNVFLDSVLLGSETSADGHYVIRYIPPGNYTLEVSRLGYATFRERITITNGKLLSRDIALMPTEIESEAVLVTAARKEQTAKMAPASVVILRAEELESRPVTTFDQALESVPGVSVYRTTGVNVQSLGIRGSSDVAGGGIGNRVLLMIDGRPALTSDAGGAYWSLVPTKLIERVEVVKGAFSSLYGSTAMGGVVNVITRRPSYKSLTSISLKGGFLEDAPKALKYYDSRRYQSEAELSYSGSAGEVSYLFNVSRKHSDGHAQNTAYEFYDVFSKIMLGLKYNRNVEITVGGGYAENDYPHSWLNGAEPLRVKDEYTDDRQVKRQFNADVHYWAVPNSNVKYSSRFYYYLNAARSYFNEDDPNYEIPFNEPFGTKTVIDGQKFGNISQLDWFVNEKHYLIAGIDTQVDHVESSPDTVLYGNRQINNIAGFMQYEYTPHPKLISTLGIRYDHNHLVRGKTLSQLSPKISFVYRPTEDMSIRLLMAQAFRAPTIAERFFQREIGGGTLFEPNPDLDAEKMQYSLEIGTRWQFSRAADLDVALFRYQYDDMIYWVDIKEEKGVTYPFFQVRNLFKALMQGVEITLNAHWNRHWRGSFNYTYLDAKDQSPNRVDDILAYRAKHSMHLNSDFRYQSLTLNVNGRYRSAIDEVFLYPSSKPDAFWVMNSKLLYKLNPTVQFSVSLNNILDTEYEELARYRMPGRNWIFGAEFTF